MRTVGVEEELLLVDPETGAALAVAGTVLEHARDDPSDLAPPEAELQQQQIEIETPPLTTLTELAAALRRARAEVDDRAREVGARVAALGTSPLPVSPETTDKRRYAAMVEHFGLTAAEQLTCGCHVHVDVASPEEGVAVLDRIRVWLPVLLALSANSPYWQGVDTGYASFRTQAWNRFPSAGPFRLFGSPEAYERFTDTLVSSGVLLDHGMVYFDARLSIRYPTVEVRVADVCLHVDDTVLLAALIRALVETAAQEWRHHVPAPDLPTDVLRLASWQASRAGLAGRLLDPLTTRPRQAADVVGVLLAHVRPALAASGEEAAVDAAWARLRQRGTGAQVQRGWAAGHDLATVCRRAADVTRE